MRPTISRRASTCASEPPSSPAPMMATSIMRVGYCNGSHEKGIAWTGRVWSPAGRGASASESPQALVAAGVNVDDHRTRRAEPRRGQAPARHRPGGRRRDAAPWMCAITARWRRPSPRRWRGSADSTSSINNAGVGTFVNVADMTPDAVGRGDRHEPDRRVQRAPSRDSRTSQQRGGGYIINISSLAGKNAFVGASAYCASKAGLNAFAEVLNQEVRHDNIKVTTIAPGSVATGFCRRRRVERRRLEDRQRRTSATS